jgi:hypothetical protein
MKIYKLMPMAVCLGCNDISNIYDTSSRDSVTEFCPVESSPLENFSAENREPMILKFRNTNFNQKKPPHLEFYVE